MRNDHHDNDFLPTTGETLINLVQDIFSLASIGSFLVTVLFWGPEFSHWLHG